MIFNTSNEQGVKALREQTEKFISGGGVVDIKKVIQTRSNRQNKALHLFFTQVADELNRIGIAFVYHGLKGQEMEMQWTGEMFKEFTWKPIQKAMYGTDRTRDLKKTEQIDRIFEVINKFFAEKGVEVSFPNEFDLYLKMYKG